MLSCCLHPGFIQTGSLTGFAWSQPAHPAAHLAPVTYPGAKHCGSEPPGSTSQTPHSWARTQSPLATKAVALQTCLGRLPLFFSKALRPQCMQLEGCPRQHSNRSRQRQLLLNGPGITSAKVVRLQSVVRGEGAAGNAVAGVTPWRRKWCHLAALSSSSAPLPPMLPPAPTRIFTFC